MLLIFILITCSTTDSKDSIVLTDIVIVGGMGNLPFKGAVHISEDRTYEVGNLILRSREAYIDARGMCLN